MISLQEQLIHENHLFKDMIGVLSLVEGHIGCATEQSSAKIRLPGSGILC